MLYEDTFSCIADLSELQIVNLLSQFFNRKIQLFHSFLLLFNFKVAYPQAEYLNARAQILLC